MPYILGVFSGTGEIKRSKITIKEKRVHESERNGGVHRRGQRENRKGEMM